MPAFKRSRSQAFGPLANGYMPYKKSKATTLVVRNRQPRRKSFVKGAIAPFGGRKELKYLDTAISQVADTTGFVSCLNLLAVGDDNTSRDGRQVTVKSIQLRLSANPEVAAMSTQMFRCMIVWDNAVNSGTIATIAMILSASTAAAFPNIDNAQRFTILWDTTYFGGRGDTAATLSASDRIGNKFICYKKINQITQYSGTTGAIGSIQNGGLLLVTIGTEASGYTLVGNARLRFTDD